MLWNWSGKVRVNEVDRNKPNWLNQVEKNHAC